MKRGFVLAIAIFVIFAILLSLVSAPLAAPGKTRIKTISTPPLQVNMSSPTTCSMIWGGNCSEGPPESFKNTFDSCDTGFGNDESINEVYINQSSVFQGNSISVTCNVMMWGIMNDSAYGCGYGWQQDRLNIYYRNSSSADWVRKFHVSQVYSCENYSVSFAPDLIDGIHEIRCITGYRISNNAACGSGDFYDNDDINFTVYSEFISITISEGTPIDFGNNANPGSTNIAAINNPLVITVDSNINFDITTKSNSDSFTSGTNSFPVSNMKWQTSLSSPLTPYSTTETLVYSDKTPGIFDIYHKLSIPNGQKQGTYTTGVVITARKTGT